MAPPTRTKEARPRKRRNGTAVTRALKPTERTLQRRWLRYSQTYIGLGCVLGFPPTRTLACWLSMGGGPFLLIGGDPLLEERLRVTWSSLRGRDPLELERRMRAVYQDLFAGDPPAIPLVESRFRAVSHPLLARLTPAAARRRTREIATFYATVGFHPVPYASAPDHLSVELHCLGFLLDQAADGGDTGVLTLQRADWFARTHLLAWLPALRAATSLRRDHGFYLSTLVIGEANTRSLLRGIEDAGIAPLAAPNGDHAVERKALAAH